MKRFYLCERCKVLTRHPLNKIKVIVEEDDPHPATWSICMDCLAEATRI